MNNDTGSGQGLLIVLLVLYFIPAIVASVRHHRNRMAITVLNIFLGWTLIGWVVALVWASTADVEPIPFPPFSTALVAEGRISHVGLCPNIPRRYLGNPDPTRGFHCRMVSYGIAEEVNRAARGFIARGRSPI